jgi:surface antigen
MSRWTTASFWALTGSMALIAAYPARAAPVAMIPGPEQADSIPTDTAGSGLPYLQCVPYARKVSGIQFFGDAHTWWDQAEGRYERGFTPKVGAVMSFHAHGAMRLGHVAMVSRIIDSRTVLLRHANWSPINGMRGQPEDDVRAVDVSDRTTGAKFVSGMRRFRIWERLTGRSTDSSTTAPRAANRALAGRSIWPAAKALSPQARHPGLPCSRPRRRNRPRQAATASTPVFSMA